MRILLAGGAGFVGSHLALYLLQEGHQVTVLDNLITGRRANLRRLERAARPGRLAVQVDDVCRVTECPGPLDAVLHLASPASPRDYLCHPIETLAAGATGTRNLLEIARRHGARFLLASTSEVYGDPLVHPQPEHYWGNVNPVGPRSVYDEAKRYAEALTTAYGRHAGVCVRIARIFNTYGPGMRRQDGRVIPTFVDQALSNTPLTVQGDGSQTRSYCYVDDLVDGLERLLWGDAEGPVNLGNPDEHTVLETARRIIRLTGSRSTIALVALPEDDPRLRRPDITRASMECGWSPRMSFDDGLALTIDDLARRRRATHAAEEESWWGGATVAVHHNSNDGRVNGPSLDQASAT
jgi:dTDP-glucose 4,6-dehydratase